MPKIIKPGQLKVPLSTGLPTWMIEKIKECSVGMNKPVSEVVHEGMLLYFKGKGIDVPLDPSGLYVGE